jgi:hypothetical protein
VQSQMMKWRWIGEKRLYSEVNFRYNALSRVKDRLRSC